MQEHREIAADRTEAARSQIFGRRTDDDVIAIDDRPAEQFVAHRAADEIGPHAPILPEPARQAGATGSGDGLRRDGASVAMLWYTPSR